MSLVEVAAYKVSCTDIDRSIAFYGLLGFVPIAPVVPRPDPDSEEPAAMLAATLYAATPARSRAAMLVQPDNPRAGRIELIEWTDLHAPANGPNVAGGGMIAFVSDDVWRDYVRLKDAGVEFCAQPISVIRPNGTNVVVAMKDPDGFVVQMSQVVKDWSALHFPCTGRHGS